VAGLAFRDVHKDYGVAHALRGVDLEVAEGELLVIVGPSGSGKSTALRVAAGLEPVTSGRVLIGGRDVTDLPPAARNVAMVFQSYALFPHLDVSENIGFGLRARRVPREEARRQVMEAAELTGCADLLDRRPDQLSGGERQRVALARALAHEPDVFLLDEPLSSLDLQLRVETRAEIKALHQRLGSTMLYVTHDQLEALSIGDRVAVLHAGQVQQVGTPEEVYRRPTNRFVGEFLGSPRMSILEGQVEGEVLRAGPFEVPLPGAAAALTGRAVEVGIRPEHFQVDEGGARLEVQVVESAGSDVYVHLRAGDRAVVARLASGIRPSVGSRLPLSIVDGGVHLFDPKTGEALWPRP